MPTQRSIKSLVVISVLLLISSCSKDGHIDLEVKNQHLDQHPAGEWIKTFRVAHSLGPEKLKEQIVYNLHTLGKLVNKYKRENNGNVITTFVWEFEGNTIKEEYYKGGIWRGPKIIPYQEYNSGEIPVWITIEFDQGIPYSTLLPNNYKQINTKREYEHTATINFTKDKARLFLFGYGALCNRISIY